MDFSNRSAQPHPAAPSTTSPAASVNSKRSKGEGSQWKKVGLMAWLLVLVVLVAAIVIGISLGGKTDDEGKYVDKSKLQAIFLNTGQVYFGNVTTLNSKYFVVNHIYYLQTSSTGTSTTATAANTSVSLVKLGCELHEPYDQMVINRDQVTFWENLQDNGQVAKAVASFEKANPNGQKCSDQSSAASNSSSSNVQNAGTAATGTSTTKP